MLILKIIKLVPYEIPVMYTVVIALTGEVEV